MRLVDTSAWIELLKGTELTPILEPQLPEPGDWLIPTIVLLELKKWTNRELEENKANDVISFTEACVVAELNVETALLAADICGKHGLSTADAIIYASALRHGAELLTCDQHFKGLASVIFVPKQKQA